jgi:hypothetical protein
MMEEYFSFDMNSIREQVENLTETQINKIEREREQKT